MLLSRLLRLFRKSVAALDDETQKKRLAVRHHRFKLFLTAWNKFQEVMTELEYTLCCDHPFGINKVRSLCTRVATQVFQCVQQLEYLDSADCTELQRRFADLQAEVAALVYPEAHTVPGPAVLPLGDPDLRGQVDPPLLRLGSLRTTLGDVVPPAFVLTASGCGQVFQHKGLQEEINRCIQVLGGISPETLPELEARLDTLIMGAELPQEIVSSLLAARDRLRELSGTAPRRLLLRGRLWPGGAERDHGMVLWGPSVELTAPDDVFLTAVRTTLACRYHARALMYQRYRGLMDAGATMCIAFLAVEEGACGGVLYTNDPVRGHGNELHMYACQDLSLVLKDCLPACGTRVAREAPFAVTAADVLSAAQARNLATLALSLEDGGGQELLWACTPSGDVRLLQLRHQGACPARRQEPDKAGLPAALLAGGKPFSVGVAAGAVCLARCRDDVRSLPGGAVLVVEKDAPHWIGLLDRVAAVIVEQGSPAGMLPGLAREFGKPVLCLPGALHSLEGVKEVTVDGFTGEIFLGALAELVASAPPPRDFMPDSPVFRLLQTAAEYILPLTLDPDSIDFRARNCRSYHDIGRYCHERAVSAMFTYGSHQDRAADCVKQLKDDVPKQFWLVNLNDGFDGPVRGPMVHISHISSRPMKYLWQGMNAYPWEGPPPLDRKGFLSVLFEATANPHLDPAAQSAYFSEKNYFLISRDYCSLHSRFGFHFVSVEARLGAREPENYVSFQLRGGAANIERRILRVRLVADILWECGFAPAVRNDAVAARTEGMSLEEGARLLLVAGYMTIHTRQLDMIMADPVQVAERRAVMMRDCRTLLTAPLAAKENVS